MQSINNYTAVVKTINLLQSTVLHNLLHNPKCSWDITDFPWVLRNLGTTNKPLFKPSEGEEIQEQMD